MLKEEGVFETLTPHDIIAAAEEFLGIFLDGTVTSYPSYVNRVYGVRSEEGERFIIKLYRPGRWTREAVEEEHQFLRQCAENEVPVVSPLANGEGVTLGCLKGILFSLMPLRSGRLFEAVKDEDWNRLGAVIGRMHTISRKDTAPGRTVCHPEQTTGKQIDFLAEEWVVPSVREDFLRCCQETQKIIIPLFQGVSTIRIHGDCHAGNILDRAEEGLLLIDFDDMMTGPAVQDLWLLLPDHFNESRHEMESLLTGYRQFQDFDSREFRLIEPLRFMRIIYYLTWCAMQQNDFSFTNHFPDWGTEAFWIKEVEDLQTQLTVIRDHLNSV